MPNSNYIVHTLHNSNINLKRISQLDQINFETNENKEIINNSYLLLSNNDEISKKNYKLSINDLIGNIENNLKELINTNNNGDNSEIDEKISSLLADIELFKSNINTKTNNILNRTLSEINLLSNDLNSKLNKLKIEVITNNSEEEYSNTRIDKLEKSLNELIEKINNGDIPTPGPGPDPEPSKTYYFWLCDDDTLNRIIENNNIVDNASDYAINSGTNSLVMKQNKFYKPYDLIQEKFNVMHDEISYNQNLYIILPNDVYIDDGFLCFSDESQLKAAGLPLNVVGFYNDNEYTYKDVNYKIITVLEQISNGLSLVRS